MSLNKDSLSEQIYKQLREDIILGNIPGGKKLTLRDLQGQFEVSSTPVREALTRLAKDRFVDYITNQGATVIELGVKDIRDLLDLCCMHDCFAIQQAMQSPHIDKMFIELQNTIERQKNFINHSQDSTEYYKEYSYIFNDFHEILYKYTDNPWLFDSAMQHNSLLFIADLSHQKPHYPGEVIQEHQEILNALIHDNIPLAIEKMQKHRENEKRRYNVSI